MQRLVCVLFLFGLGCARSASPPPVPPAKPIISDLGDLNHLEVREQIAAREQYRARLKAVYQCFARAFQRAVACEAAFERVGALTLRGVVPHCSEQITLFGLNHREMPPEFKLVYDLGVSLTETVEKGGYRQGEPALEERLSFLERRLERLELYVSLTSGALKKLLECAGMEIEIKHPDGTVLFRTEGYRDSPDTRHFILP